MITKNYLIDKIHDKLNYLSKEDVKDSVDLILDYLNESLKEQKRIEIRNFGNFSIRKCKFPESENSIIRFITEYLKIYLRSKEVMEWAKYSTIEKWQIIKSMVLHDNIFPWVFILKI